MVVRYILAFVLSLAVIIGWQILFPPRVVRPPDPVQAPAPGAHEEPAAAQKRPAGAEKDPARPDDPQVEPAADAAGARIVRERREVEVRISDRFTYTADSRGAALRGVRLPRYHESLETKDDYPILGPTLEGFDTLGLAIEKGGQGGSAIPPDESWTLVETPLDDGGVAVEFENEVDSVALKKVIVPGDPGDFVRLPGAPGQVASPRHLRCRIEITNVSGEEKKLIYRLYGPAGIDSESLTSEGSDIGLVFGTWGAGGKVTGTWSAPAKLPRPWESRPGIAWVGISNNYFAAVLFPLTVDRQPSHVDRGFGEVYADPRSLSALARSRFGRDFPALSPAEAATIIDKAYLNLRVGFRSASIVLEPGETVVHEYGLYVGPREAKDLAAYGDINLPEVNQYGVFGILVKLFISLLGLLNKIALGSWGLAIVLLTFLVKLCLHPINKRSQASMQRFQKKLQKIKPQMDEIKQRHASNRLKMNQEMQKLWKEHGVNPGQQMAGCLVLFLQLPIWWGLYSTLQYAIGLRQTGFLYIDDLTRPDHLFHMGFSLPFIGDYFNLLPVVYVILTVVNQRLQPRPDDPQMQAQYRMMTFMMIFFGFIFYSFPAGFMLYIMTSAGLGIAESKIIKAEIAREEAKASGAATAAIEASRPDAPLYGARAKKSEAEGKGPRRKRGR